MGWEFDPQYRDYRVWIGSEYCSPQQAVVLEDELLDGRRRFDSRYLVSSEVLGDIKTDILVINGNTFKRVERLGKHGNIEEMSFTLVQ